MADYDNRNTNNIEAPSTKPATDPPNRQDSRAYSTFTFNPEMSTQAALLQAHQAFQDTQSPEKPNVQANDEEDIREDAAIPSTAAPTDTVTPFKRPGIPSFFTRAPESMTRAVPASTQDLMNAAADLNWSTAKKTTQKKKRISFADWPQAKPSQLIGSMKPVEWSPFAETPLPARSDKQPEASRSQPKETPVKGVPTKLSLSFADTYDDVLIPKSQHLAQPKSSTLARSELSAPSAAPIPSYQEAQEYDTQEIENALDDAVSFLSTWDVDKVIRENSDGRKGGGESGFRGRRG
jgi:hypothetical protein